MILETKITHLMLKFLLHVYTFVIMGYSMIPFILLKQDKYIQVYKQFYFIPHIIYLTIILLGPILNRRTSRRVVTSPTPTPRNPESGESNPTIDNKLSESSNSNDKKKTN